MLNDLNLIDSGDRLRFYFQPTILVYSYILLA